MRHYTVMFTCGFIGLLQWSSILWGILQRILRGFRAAVKSILGCIAYRSSKVIKDNARKSRSNICIKLINSAVNYA